MDKLQAVIVEPYGTVRVTEIKNKLGAFQAVVGGYIEPVFGRIATIYVNDEGLLLDLPSNPHATAFARRYLDELAPVLRGTALILGPGDGEGNDTPVRQSVVDHFTKEG